MEEAFVRVCTGSSQPMQAFGHRPHLRSSTSHRKIAHLFGKIWVGTTHPSRTSRALLGAREGLDAASSFAPALAFRIWSRGGAYITRRGSVNLFGFCFPFEGGPPDGGRGPSWNSGATQTSTSTTTSSHTTVGTGNLAMIDPALPL